MKSITFKSKVRSEYSKTFHFAERIMYFYLFLHYGKLPPLWIHSNLTSSLSRARICTGLVTINMRPLLQKTIFYKTVNSILCSPQYCYSLLWYSSWSLDWELKFEALNPSNQATEIQMTVINYISSTGTCQLIALCHVETRPKPTSPIKHTNLSL